MQSHRSRPVPAFAAMALLVMLACDTAADSAEAPGLAASARLSTVIPTVLVVEWSAAPDDAVVSVEWGNSEALGQRVELGTGESGSGTVVGLRSGETGYWRLVVESAAGGSQTDTASIEVGFTPDDLPALLVDQRAEPAGGGILTSLIGGKPYAVIYDYAGMPIWWYSLDAEDAVFADTRMRPDGRGVLLQVMDGSRRTDIGALLSVDWSGESPVETRLEGGHHAFAVLPDGTRAWCAMDVRDVSIDGTTYAVVGDSIRELGPGLEAESDVRTVWSAWDTLPMRADPATDSGFYPEGLDWTHCNGLAYDEAADAYLMSAFAIGSVVSVSRTTGALNWVLGGEDGQFTFVGGDGFLQAHSPEPHAGGMRLFSNRNGGDDEPLYSRVVDYELDLEAGTATEVSAISLNKKYFSYILGDSNALPDDHLLISWGSTGAFTEVNANRELVWTGSLPIGKIAGFAENVPTMGGPR